MQVAIKRKLLKFSPVVKVVVIGVILFVCLIFFIKVYLPVYHFIQKNNITPAVVKNLVFNSNPPIKQYQDRTNFVLLGISDTDDLDLTDSIIYISLEVKKNNGLMVSIPRDLWLPSLKARINTAYHYGEERQPGGGFILIKSAVSEVIGQPVHYVLLVDFSGFKKIIDVIGGVRVNVPETFEDKLFPIPGKEDDFCGGDPDFSCRFETVSFEKGLQEMDGEKALKYVRSRQAQGKEGTDFSRSERQQQALLALKEKLLTKEILTKPALIKQLFTLLDDAIKSDMNWSEKIITAKYLYQLKENNLRKLTLDQGDEKEEKKGFLVNPPLWQYNGAWVLVPRTGNFEEIQKYISCYLSDPSCTLQP